MIIGIMVLYTNHEENRRKTNPLPPSSHRPSPTRGSKYHPMSTAGTKQGSSHYNSTASRAMIHVIFLWLLFLRSTYLFWDEVIWDRLHERFVVEPLDHLLQLYSRENQYIGEMGSMIWNGEWSRFDILGSIDQQRIQDRSLLSATPFENYKRVLHVRWSLYSSISNPKHYILWYLVRPVI